MPDNNIWIGMFVVGMTLECPNFVQPIKKTPGTTYTNIGVVPKVHLLNCWFMSLAQPKLR